MPTTQQLEKRLGRVKKQAAGSKEAAEQRQLHKTQRRLQRKLRAWHRADAPKVKPAKGAAAPSGGQAPTDAPASPPAAPAGG